MKLTISSSDLSSHIQQVSKVANSKNSYSILECLLFEVKNSTLSITASDSETTLITTLPVISCDCDGSFAINAKNIQDSVKEIPEQPVTFDINPDNHEIKVTYMNGQFNLVGQDERAYPEIKELDGEISSITVSAKILQSFIGKCLFATANDELRPVMNGIYFDITPEGTTLVASDGHKLVRCKSLSSTGNDKTSFILPQKPATFMKALLAKEDEETEVVISFNSRNAVFKLGESTMYCRFIEGRYPNYNSVIPQDNPYRLTIDRQQLIGALRRVLLFSSQSSGLVKLTASNGELLVSGQDIDFSTSAEEKVACDYTNIEMSIGFKGPFLLDILNNISSQEVVVELADPSRAGVIMPAEQEEGEDVLTILMPMMLND